MKKLIILGLVGILLVTVIGLAVFVIYLDSMVKAGIEAAGPQITGTTVTVEAVRLSLLTGEGRVKGLVIGNPKGYQAPSAFKLATAGTARCAIRCRCPSSCSCRARGSRAARRSFRRAGR